MNESPRNLPHTDCQGASLKWILSVTTINNLLEASLVSNCENSACRKPILFFSLGMQSVRTKDKMLCGANLEKYYLVALIMLREWS